MSAMERVITIGEAGVLKTGITQKGANSGRPWTLSIIKDSTGKGYTTFKDGLRELAQGNIGAEAKILFTQDGDRVTLEGLEILTEATHSPSNGTGELIQVGPGLPYQNGSKSLEEQRQLKIMRQSAAKVAAELLKLEAPEDQNYETFQLIVSRLLDLFENGVDDQIGIPFGA